MSLQRRRREQSSHFHSLASNNPRQQGIHTILNFIQEVEVGWYVSIGRIDLLFQVNNSQDIMQVLRNNIGT